MFALLILYFKIFWKTCHKESYHIVGGDIKYLKNNFKNEIQGTDSKFWGEDDLCKRAWLVLVYYWDLNCIWWVSMCRVEKEMAAHSSVLDWRIPGTSELGGLPSVGSHRVGHDWSDLAAATAAAAATCRGIKERKLKIIEHSSWQG